MKGHRGTCTDFFQFCYLHCFWSNLDSLLVDIHGILKKLYRTFSWVRNSKSSKANQNMEDTVLNFLK